MDGQTGFDMWPRNRVAGWRILGAVPRGAARTRVGLLLLYDAVMTQRAVLHVVYEGPGLAGKTTSMEHVRGRLRHASALQRSVSQHGVQRLSFVAATDQIELRVSSLTGTVQCDPHRVQELRSADAVVFVVDSRDV